jgi:hypothetical protein
MAYQDNYEKVRKLTKLLFILTLVSMFVVYAQVVLYVVYILLAKELRAVGESNEIGEFRKTSGFFTAVAILGLSSFAMSMVITGIFYTRFFPFYMDLMTSYPMPDPEDMINSLVILFNSVFIFAIPGPIIAIVISSLSRAAWTQMDVFFSNRTSGSAHAQGTKGTRKAISGTTLGIVSNAAFLPLLICCYFLVASLSTLMYSYSSIYGIMGLAILTGVLSLVAGILGLISTIFQVIGISNVNKGFEALYEAPVGGGYGVNAQGGWNVSGNRDVPERDVRFDAVPVIQENR